MWVIQVVLIMLTAGSLVAAVASADSARHAHLAADRQAAEAKRANDRLDEIDRAAAEEKKREAQRQRVRWELKHQGARSWTLKHVGTEPAREVRLQASGAVLRVGGSLPSQAPVRLAVVRPGQTLPLMIVPTSQLMIHGGDRTLTINWDGLAEPEVIHLPVV